MILTAKTEGAYHAAARLPCALPLAGMQVDIDPDDISDRSRGLRGDISGIGRDASSVDRSRQVVPSSRCCKEKARIAAGFLYYQLRYPPPPKPKPKVTLGPP
jgi:hypothetical protein